MKNKIIVVILLAALFAGCKKNLLDLSNPNQLTVESYYKTEADAVGAVNAVYAVMQHMSLFRQYQWIIYDGMSDDVSWASTDDEPANAMFNFNFTPTMGASNTMWGTLYTGVFRANQVIKYVGAMPDFATKNRIIGEARFLRAWYYFELARGWGAVPEITEPLAGAQSSYSFPKATQQEIYELIKQDLQFAEQNLPAKSGYNAANAGRATSGAASAYLGKVFLYQKKWNEAAAQFEKVIGSGEYQLTQKFADNFSAATENNKESVFEVQFSAAGTGIWNEDDASIANESNLLPVSYFNWVTLGSMYQFKRNQLFGPAAAGRSPRYNATFTTNANGAPRIKKYVEFNTSDFRRSDVNIRDMRFADVLLMYGEALNEAGRKEDAKNAIDLVIARVRTEQGLAGAATPTDIKDLKTVQQLINLGFIGSYTFSDDKDGVRNIVKYERRVEFMYEQKRYKDLVRWGDAEAAMEEWNTDNGGARVFVVGKHELFPIPETEISGNAGISDGDQNPGY